jgi:hypothetical protein
LEGVATAHDRTDTSASWAGLVFGAGLDHLGRHAKHHLAVTFLSHGVGGYACDRMAAARIRITLFA